MRQQPLAVDLAVLVIRHLPHAAAHIRYHVCRQPLPERPPHGVLFHLLALHHQHQPLALPVKQRRTRGHAVHRAGGGFDLAQLDAVAHALDLEIPPRDI